MTINTQRTEYFKKYHQDRKKEVKHIKLTFSVEEYNLLHKIAEREGLKTTTLIKKMALTQIGKTFYNKTEIQAKLDDFIFLVRNIANNINQIARHSNTIKQVIEENKVLSFLQDLEKRVVEFVKKS